MPNKRVAVSSDRGMLRLCLPKFLFSKQKYIYLGLEDTPINRAIAEAKAKIIEQDLIFETFDFTLKKYSFLIGQQEGKEQRNSERNFFNIKSIITEYVTFKQAQVSEGNRNYKTFLNWLDKIDSDILDKPDLLTN